MQKSHTVKANLTLYLQMAVSQFKCLITYIEKVLEQANAIDSL